MVHLQEDARVHVWITTMLPASYK